MKKEKTDGSLPRWFKWPLYLSVLMILAVIAAAFVSFRAAAAVAVVAVLYFIAAGLLFFYGRKRITGSLVSFGAAYSWSQRQLLASMELPYGMADTDGRLLWTNKAFATILKGDKSYGKNLVNIFPEITPDALADMDHSLEVHVSYGDRYYRVSINRVVITPEEGILSEAEEKTTNEQVLAVYLYDETEIFECRQAIDDQKMVAGLIYLDNYDEALESVEEVRRSLLMALIDRRVNKYISSVDGIVKKLEKDKYFFVIKQKYMDQLEADHFSLLEDVKSVNIGNEMSVTLSIGIGMNGDTYEQCYDFARAAIDMALGRGGDQTVIKNGENIEYYGGKSQQAEKTTRVKARVKAHALRELLETVDSIVIMGHQNCDIDVLGAAVGMYRIAATLDKRAHIVINDMTSSIKSMINRFSMKEGYPADLFLNGDEAKRAIDQNTALVIVDVNRPSYTEEPSLLDMVQTVVVIDHHRQSSEAITKATLSYVEPSASSSSEMIAEILQYVADDIRIRSQEADAMYAGIVIDTNNFTNQTGARTFDAAAFLRRNGADVTRVRKLFRDNLEDCQAKAAAVSNAEVYKDGFAISVCPSEGLDSPTVVGAQAANELLNVEGIKASIVMTPFDGTIYLSARSIDEVNVQVMMELLGGGGHRTVAGAQLTGTDVDDARARIKAAIDVMEEKGEL